MPRPADRIAPRRFVAGALSAWLPSTSASAASVSMDFGYRLERSLDPDKRGPAEDVGGMDLLMGMCEPQPDTDSATEPVSTAVTKAAEAAGAAIAPAATKPAATAGAGTLAAATAAAMPPVDPASSAEPELVAFKAIVSDSVAHLELLDAHSVSSTLHGHGLGLTAGLVGVMEQVLRHI